MTEPNDPAGFDLGTVDRLLTTTRAVRRRLDFSRPVPLEVVTECLRLALQAPTGSNRQAWRWLVVTDPEIRAALAELYKHPPVRVAAQDPDDAPSDQQRRMLASARYLMQRMEQVPVMVVPCIERGGGAAGWAPSIYPAVWSFLLALRSRGLGSVITTAHLYREAEAASLLGVPDNFVQACLLPVAYYTGEDFRPADRRPLEEVGFRDRWGEPLA